MLRLIVHGISFFFGNYSFRILKSNKIKNVLKAFRA